MANIDSNDISAYSIGSNGPLTPLPSSPFPARGKPASVAITQLLPLSHDETESNIMNSNEFSRRDFVRSTGLTAVAVVFGQAIGLGPDYAKATSEQRSALSDYERYDGLGLAGLVKEGAISASELLEMAIERVEQRNPVVNAVVDRMYDEAKATVAAGLPSGPFRRRALPAQGYRAVICRHNHHLWLQRFSQVHS